MSPVKWINGRPEDVFAGGFDQYEQNVREALLAIAANRVPEIENWMRDNAIWEDRSGNARQALYADYEAILGGVLLFMDHGVDYGYWLEVANTGTYSIIRPALDHWAPIIWADVEALFAS